MNKLSEELSVVMYDHDPADSTVKPDVAWVDMKDYDKILIKVMASALTGTGLIASGFLLIANPNSDGSGTDVTIKTHAMGTAVDAVGDQDWLECTKDEIVAAGSILRYVSANLDMQNAADEAVVVYIRSAKTKQAGLTVDIIA